MQSKQFLKAGILALALVIIGAGSWEFYLRKKGYKISYDDGKVLWSDVRKRIYQPADDATVFIGSSRIKYDLDIPTWKQLTGEDAVQLAVEGNSPVPSLHDLAIDEDFRGKLVIDVTEPLFFSQERANNKEVHEFIEYNKKRTPSEKFSSLVNYPLEKNFVFLNRDYFSINGLLSSLNIPKRKDVFVFPYFTHEFSYNTHDRQSWMTEKFLHDTALQNDVTAIWAMFGEMAKSSPPLTDEIVQKMMTGIKNDVDKIRSRGGKVIFVRTPSSGPMLMGEQHGFPREKFWDKLLAVTNSRGIHFQDHPQIASFICPEWSHLSPADAKIFTQNFVKLLESEGWFSQK